MNEKEWLIEDIENFISDLDDTLGNTDTPELIPILKSLINSLESYILLLHSCVK